MDDAMIKDTLGNILEKLGLQFDSITVAPDAQEEAITRVDIVCEKPSRIIGWHGETLNSVQHLLKSIIRSQQKLDRSPFIVVDVDGYRRMQEDKVCKAAERKADFVRRTGNRVALPPMSPYFRRIVHLHIANTPEFADLTTISTGEGDYRQVVLCLKDGVEPAGGEELAPVIEDEPVADDGLENLDI